MYNAIKSTLSVTTSILFIRSQYENVELFVRPEKDQAEIQKSLERAPAKYRQESAYLDEKQQPITGITERIDDFKDSLMHALTEKHYKSSSSSSSSSSSGMYKGRGNNFLISQLFSSAIYLMFDFKALKLISLEQKASILKPNLGQTTGIHRSSFVKITPPFVD
jgi:hypothetical protein